MYLLLLLSIVLVGLGTATAAPTWSTLVQREKEEELRVRLAEYRAAIARYRADHNRYPQKLEDLLVDTSQLQPKRYLRRLYPDPFTGRVDWTLELVQDRTGAVSGIANLRSRSTLRSIRVVDGKTTYREW